jgi:hypothetical protein
VTAHSGRGSGESRPPFAARKTPRKPPSEPRVERPKAARTSGCPHCSSALANPPGQAALLGLSRVDRSLWPGFWRIPAPVRGSENASKTAFRAAREAAEGRENERLPALLNRACQPFRPRPPCLAFPGLTAHSGRGSGESRPPFAALKTPRKPPSEPRGKRPKAARTSGCPHRSSALANPSGQAALPGLSRFDRSLWPGFWRIPAPVRGSENASKTAFRAAHGAAEGRENERLPASLKRACQPFRPNPLCLAFPGLTAHSGPDSGESRPPFAALKTPRKPPSEPRVERPKAARTSGCRHRSSALANPSGQTRSAWPFPV